MHRRRAWVVILALAGCVSSRVIESDVDATQGVEPERDLTDETACCAEADASKDAGFAADARSPDPSNRPSANIEAGLGGFDPGRFGLGGGDAGCVYLSQHFEEGATFRANDGCNTCECRGGLVLCDLIGCLGHAANCDLPFDPGSCDESHLYYAYNASTGLCEPQTYSGCGGNFNRFEEYGICAYRCSLRPGQGKDCKYEGNSYRHRQRVARKPSDMVGCGPCFCNDGEVLCPPADCECPDGGKLGLQCVGCTQSGGCSDLEERCFPSCDDDADCETRYGLFCDKAQGVCIAKPSCLR